VSGFRVEQTSLLGSSRFKYYCKFL